MNKTYENVNVNKLVDELQAVGILDREAMSFFPTKTGLNIKFKDIKEEVETIDSEGNDLDEDFYTTYYTKKIEYMETIVNEETGEETERLYFVDENYTEEFGQLLEDIQLVVDAHDPIESVKCDYISKISDECSELIKQGFYFEINGETKHFSMTIYDQIKLATIANMVQNGAEMVTWHPDGDACIELTATEFMDIYGIAFLMVSYLTTKFNTGIRPYICDTKFELISDLEGIDMSFKLSEEYENDVLDKTAKGIGKTVEEISPIILAYGW